MCYGQGQEDGPLRGNNEDTEKSISTVDVGQSWCYGNNHIKAHLAQHAAQTLGQDGTDEVVEKDLNQVKKGSDKKNVSYCVVSRAC